MIKEGYIKPENKNLLLVDTTVEGLMQQMYQYKAPQKGNIIQKIVR
jgi:predicted Rossmann-fold nucleotide-binding protein